MFNITEYIIDSYLTSKEYEEFSEEHGTEDVVKKARADLVEKFGEENREVIDTALMAAFSTGEHYELIQGVGMGLNLMHEHK